MTTTAKTLAVNARFWSERVSHASRWRSRQLFTRQLTSSPRRYEESSSSQHSRFVKQLGPNDRLRYDNMSPEERKEAEEHLAQLDEHMNRPDVQRRLDAAVEAASRETQRALPRERQPQEDRRSSAAAEEGEIEDEEFGQDDITALGHGELEQQREIREYARIAAWELPLLSKFAKPFEPPSKALPLRFRTTTYLGEEHPAAKKVVVEFCTSDITDLSEVQRHKLIKLAGPRYDPKADIVRMSGEMFETPAQNKRYLGDLIGTLLTEARDSTDTFEDVPFDFRYYKKKPRPAFPKEWNLTEQRRHELEDARQKKKKSLAEKAESLDGAQVIESALMGMAPEPVAVAQLPRRRR